MGEEADEAERGGEQGEQRRRDRERHVSTSISMTMADTPNGMHSLVACVRGMCMPDLRSQLEEAPLATLDEYEPTQQQTTYLRRGGRGQVEQVGDESRGHRGGAFLAIRRKISTRVPVR
jgi:hypothetical protein